MLDYPQTLGEAEEYRYGVWGGRPAGMPYRPGYCAFEVFPAERGAMHHQCLRRSGHGPAGLYCGLHAQRATPPAGRDAER